MAKRRKNANGSAIEANADAKRQVVIYLQAIIGSLNPRERRIAECFLADPERTITAPIAEIKRLSGASVGAIFAFCRRLGFEGFADFKIALTRDLAQTGLPAGDSKHRGSLYEKVFQFHALSLEETLRMNPESTFQRVAQALEKAQKIEFFSIGLSYPVAYTAYCKFQLIALPASAQFDAHIQLIAATQLKAGDVAFGISCSGTTRETVQCLEVARAQGATTICLTNAMKSAITTFSDHCIYATPSEIKYFQAPLASRITQLAVIDALFVSLALKHKNKTAGFLQRSAEVLRERR